MQQSQAFGRKYARWPDFGAFHRVAMSHSDNSLGQLIQHPKRLDLGELLATNQQRGG